MIIQRHIKANIIKDLLGLNKAIIIYGPRRTGKTTLTTEIIKELNLKTLFINADEQKYEDILSSRDNSKISELVAGYELLVIDEAQRIPDIGLNLKILIDNNPKLKIIVTGSSYLELASGISEPLTGRKTTHSLFPIAQLELQKTYNAFELKDQLEERLIYGSYPEIFGIKGFAQKEKYLKELSVDYLYKDILAIASIRNPIELKKLLKLLAFQIGSLVSYNELATTLGISKETVVRYVDLLEKSFVIFKLSGFSNNPRKEISKSNKIYFFDLGIRNAVIDNFHSLTSRNDAPQLWENFLIAERIKFNSYQEIDNHPYFWRTYSGVEIDYIEEWDNQLAGFEIKYGKKKGREPKSFLNQYKNSTWEIINLENWLQFITKLEK